jgi:hypothetical protein
LDIVVTASDATAAFANISNPSAELACAVVAEAEELIIKAVGGETIMIVSVVRWGC